MEDTKSRGEGRGEERREREFASTGSLHRWLQWPGLIQTESRIFELWVIVFLIRTHAKAAVRARAPAAESNTVRLTVMLCPFL